MTKKLHLAFLALVLGVSAAFQSCNANFESKPEITIELSRLLVENWGATQIAKPYLKIEFVSQTNLIEMSKRYSVGTDQFVVLRQTGAKRQADSSNIYFERLLRRRNERFSISTESNMIGDLKETLWYSYSVRVPIKVDAQQPNVTDTYDLEKDSYHFVFFVRAAQMKLFSGRIESNRLTIPKEDVEKAIAGYKSRANSGVDAN